MADAHDTSKPPQAFLRVCFAGVFGFAALAGAQTATNELWRDWESAKIRMHVQRAADLRRYYYEGTGLDAAIAAEQQEVRKSLINLKNAAPPPPQSGVRLEAYISEIDDSAQPFWRYLPQKRSAISTAPPLLVFLHGYDPYITFASFPCFPMDMTNLAERTGAAIVEPFGRGNTDFQHIGEQDVLRVIDEMQIRYGTDADRVVLMGVSMGGLGVWCVGARWAERFNALLPISGRGDFYVWHAISPSELPSWQRELVDNQFATRYLERLLNTPIMATHGRYDDIVSFAQGSYPLNELRRLGATRTRLITFTDAGHDIFGYSWFYKPLQQFLEEALTQVYPKPVRRAQAQPGATGSRLQDAFLSPFMFIGGDDGGTGTSLSNLQARAQEWQRFAFAQPRMALETQLKVAQVAKHNLFVFGEPETSPLVSAILRRAQVDFTDEAFFIDGRKLPRQAHGLWFTGLNPFNTNLTAVVQAGIPWGERLPNNHRYDRIPDFIVYTNDTDRWGCNIAVAAGFIGLDQKVRWSEPPFTEAIRRPPDPPPWPWDDDARIPGLADEPGYEPDPAPRAERGFRP